MKLHDYAVRTVFYSAHILTGFWSVRRLLMFLAKSRIGDDLKENHVNLLCLKALGLNVRLTYIPFGFTDNAERVSHGQTYVRILRGWTIVSTGNRNMPTYTGYRSGDYLMLVNDEYYRLCEVGDRSWMIQVIHAPTTRIKTHAYP